MHVNEISAYAINKIEKDLGYPYELSLSSIFKIKRKVVSGSTLDESIEFHYDKLKVLTNLPTYWTYVGKINSYELAEFYAANPKSYKLCRICNIAYNRDTLDRKDKWYGKVCSQKCRDIVFEEHNKNLSDSKKLYNNRDAAQYAKRHNISMTEATEILYCQAIYSSPRRIEYWIKKGFSEGDAVLKISELQSVISMRRTEYWISKGYTEAESIKKVSEYQRKVYEYKLLKYINNPNIFREASPFCKEYWIKYHGMNNIEAKNKSTTVSKNISEKARHVFASMPTEYRNRANWMRYEYWQHRHPDDWQEKYAYSRSHAYKGFKQSKWATELINYIVEAVYTNNTEKLYFLDNEFFRYVNNSIRFYDFVDTSNRLVIEFHGNYWHSFEKQKIIDKDKKILWRTMVSII